MQLDNLHTLIQTLKEHAERHSDVLLKNELLTRYALIDPLLRELGWDTGNPDEVRPEYSAGRGRVDYALMSDGEPVIMIEAKSLGTNLHDSTLTQGLTYCVDTATPYFAVTDGMKWIIYDAFKRVQTDDKIIINFDLASMVPSEVVLKALVLWRRNLQSGSLATPETPLVSPHTVAAIPHTPLISPQAVTPVPPAVDPRASQDLNELPSQVATMTGRPLSEVQSQSRQAAPGTLILPDATQRTVKSWRDLYLHVLGYWVETGALTSGHCPVRRDRAKTRYIINVESKHPSGNDFTHPAQVGPLWAETHASQETLLSNLRVVAQSTGASLQGFSFS